MLRSADWYLQMLWDNLAVPFSSTGVEGTVNVRYCSVTTSMVTVFSFFRRGLIVMNTLKFAKSLRKLQKQQLHCQKPADTWPLLLRSKAAMFAYCHVARA